MKTLFGDNYPRLCLDKKGFIRWIHLLNPNIIDKNLRPSHGGGVEFNTYYSKIRKFEIPEEALEAIYKYPKT